MENNEGKIKAWSPNVSYTDKKWVALAITNESGKVIGKVTNVPAAPSPASYIRTHTPELKQFLLDNKIGKQSKYVHNQFFLETNSQKAINKLFN